MDKKGLLLINLGTPEAPTPPAVKTYLAQFLTDPFVIDLPWLFRILLVYGLILPTRPKKSAAAYAKIWSSRGSPLLTHSLDLVAKVQTSLQASHAVELGMRYGNPSIESGLADLKNRGVKELTIFPLYPQYSWAATESSVVEATKQAKKFGFSSLNFVSPFFDSAAFIDAFANIAPNASTAYDHVLFSFHGVPERQIKRVEAQPGFCFSSVMCCDAMTHANKNCYRAQCFATARELAKQLGLPSERYTVSFQSRLGVTPWIQPYTDKVIPALAQSGVQRLLVYCPAFVADCLETLEEIGIRGAESFRESGGQQLDLAPSLNSSERWVQAVCSIANQTR